MNGKLQYYCCELPAVDQYSPGSLNVDVVNHIVDIATALEKSKTFITSCQNWAVDPLY